MKRTKGMKNTHLDLDTEKLIYTCYNVSQYIPGCTELIEYHDNLFTHKFDLESLDTTYQEILAEMRKGIKNWLEQADDLEIYKTLRPIRLNPELRKFLIALKILKLFPTKYRSFLESDNRGIPNDFVAPTPFLVMPKQAKDIALTKPLVRICGQTKIEIRGSVMRAEDQNLVSVLLMLCNKQAVKITEQTIGFRTSYKQIAEELRKKQPQSTSTKNGIFAGLTRIDTCRLTLTNIKGLRTLGGIITKVKELETKNGLELLIYLDRDFIKLVDEGFVKTDPETDFSLSPTQLNLFKYFQRQKLFKLKGVLMPVSIYKVFDYAGLGGIEEKEKAYQRRILRKTLQELQDRRLIGRYKIKNDLLTINSIRHAANQTES